MADFEKKIRIDTQATGDGATKTVDSLNKVTQAAKQAGSASSDLSDDLQRQVAASKLTTAATDVQETSVKRLATGFKQLGHEIPAVGVLLNVLKNPWTFIAAGIALVVVKFKELIAVQHELARTGADLSARLDPLINQQVRNRQLLFDQANAAETFNQKLRDQAGALDDVRQRQEEANDAFERGNRREAAIEQADKGLALAEAGDDPAKRAAVEHQFEARERQRQQFHNARREEAARRAERETRALRDEAAKALPGARAALTAAEQAAGGRSDDVDAALKLHDEEGARLQSDLAEAELGAKGPFAMPGLGESAQQRVAKARAAIASHAQGRDALLTRKKRIDASTGPARQRVSDLERQQSEASAALPGLQSRHKSIVAEEENERATFAAVTPIKDKTRQLVAEFAAIKEALEEGNRLARETRQNQERENREMRKVLESDHGR